MREPGDLGAEANSAAKPRQLREGVDYYLEDGLMVFTEDFLRERGYCCESGCRHCPYGFRRLKQENASSSENL